MTGSSDYSFFFLLLLIVGVCVVFYFVVRNSSRNTPTWRGIIISAILGMLPMYLILCFFGVMGEEREDAER